MGRCCQRDSTIPYVQWAEWLDLAMPATSGIIATSGGANGLHTHPLLLQFDFELISRTKTDLSLLSHTRCCYPCVIGGSLRICPVRRQPVMFGNFSTIP